MKTSDSVDQQQLWAVLKTYLFSGVMILTALSRSIELNVVSAQVLQPVHFVALQFGPEGFPSYASLLDQLSFDTSVLDSLAPGSLDNSQVEKGQLIFRWSVARRLAPAVDAHQVTQLLLDVKPSVL